MTTHGQNWRVYLDALDISGIGNNTTVNLTADAPDTLVFGQDWMTRMPGTKDSSIDFSGLFDTSVCGFDERMSELLNASAIVGVFPEKPDDGKIGYEGKILETAYTVTGPANGPVAVSATMTGSGRMSRTLVLSGCAAYTTVGSAAGTLQALSSTSGTTGANVVSNSSFNDNTTGWSAAANTTIAREIGGQSGSCLKVTAITAVAAYAYQGVDMTNRGTHKLSLYHKNGTTAGRLKIGRQGNDDIYSASWSDANWTQHVVYFTATCPTIYLNLVHAIEIEGHTTLWDEVSVEPVTGTKTLGGAFLRVTAASATAGLSASGWVQHSAASDAEFTNLAAFTPFSASGAELMASPLHAHRWLRAKWDTTGATNPDIDFIISAETYD